MISDWTDIPFKILVPLVVADHQAHPKPHHDEIFLGSLGTLGSCHNGMLFFGFDHEILPLFTVVLGLQGMVTQHQTILGEIWVLSFHDIRFIKPTAGIILC